MFRAIEIVLTRGARHGMPLVLTLALGVMATGSATAQQRSNTRPTDNLRNNPNIPRDPFDRGGQTPSDNSSGDFPSAEMHFAVDANARAAFARANFRRLQSSLDQAIRRMQFDFEHSPELTDASRAEQQAWDAYVAARRTALKGVMENPTYRANLAAKEQLGDQIAEVRAEYLRQMPRDRRARRIVDTEMMQQLVNMATVKLDYAQVTTDMEVAALRNDSRVADAREHLRSAGARVTALREQFDRTVRDSQELASIRNQIEDARVQVVTSQAFQSGANVVAAEALDFAYYKNRFTYNYPAAYWGPGWGW